MGEGDQVVVPTVVTAGTGKAVGKDATLQIFAKSPLDIRGWRVVVALAVELASSSQVSKCSATVRYSRVRSGWRGL